MQGRIKGGSRAPIIKHVSLIEKWAWVIDGGYAFDYIEYSYVHNTMETLRYFDNYN